MSTDPKISPNEAPDALDPYLLKTSFSSRISNSLIDNLTQGKKRILILYWTEGMKIDDIYDIMSDNISYYDDVIIEDREDINKVINKSIYDLFTDFNSDFPHFVSTYKIDKKTWRNIIKYYFELNKYKN